MSTGRVDQYIAETKAAKGMRPACAALAKAQREPINQGAGMSSAVKTGDHVRYVVEGAVVLAGLKVVSIKDKRSGNVIWVHTRDVEIIEPRYALGTIVRSAFGSVFQRTETGWQGFGSVRAYPPSHPGRPLTVIDAGQQ